MNGKRKAGPEAVGEGGNVAKRAKPWQQKRPNMRRRDNEHHHIVPGDKGIWATCDRGNEHRATDELLDILNTYAARLYPADRRPTGPDVHDIEAEINLELLESNKLAEQVLFSPVKLDVQCVIFFKTSTPVDPVDLVHYICTDLATSRPMLSGRFVRRLTPAGVIGKANEKGLEEIAAIALGPVFHMDADVIKQFAIRTTIRNHSTMRREEIISRVAQIVGSRHSVNLDNPEIIILVDIYKNICSMSAVTGDYDRLKKYNLTELAKAARDISG